MSGSFEERLARLEQKPIEQGGTPSIQPATPIRSNGGGQPKNQSGWVKKPSAGLLTIGLIVALPVAAWHATLHVAKDTQLAASMSEKAGSASEGAKMMLTGVKGLGIFYGPTADPERRDARHKIDTAMIRARSGQMSAEEFAYHGSMEGMVEMAENQKKAMDFDEMKALAKKLHGKD